MKKTWKILLALCLMLIFTGVPVYAQMETETAGASLGKEVYEIDPYQISLCSAGWVNQNGQWKYIDADGSYAKSAWRKIDGKWQWLDYYGNWVDDDKYRDYVEPAIKGIDVSRWQEDIDWECVKEAGIEFVMLKIGGNSQKIDPKYKENIKAANEVGIPVGVYYYSKAQNTEDAIRDAQFVIENMEGYTISYPVAIDIEDECQKNLNRETLGAIAKAFCDEIRKAGYMPMIYCNEDWYKNRIDMSMLENVEKWVARYNYFYDTEIERGIWQSSSEGRIPGIQGAVDINFGYKDYTELITPRTEPDANYKKTQGKWMYSTKGWWYSYNNGGYPANGWAEIDEKWYWFDSQGYMKSGWLYENKIWYYLNLNGEMVTGWEEIGENWYYFKPNGAMVTGWLQYNEEWYYMNASGIMITGWGKIGENWYYFNSNGEMVTGWLQYNSKWYYTNAAGAMVTGWLQYDNNWYYTNAAGEMVTGWLRYGNNWYYLKPNGEMAVGQIEIQGEMNQFNNSGVWLDH